MKGYKRRKKYIAEITRHSRMSGKRARYVMTYLRRLRYDPDYMEYIRDYKLSNVPTHTHNHDKYRLYFVCSNFICEDNCNSCECEWLNCISARSTI